MSRHTYTLRRTTTVDVETIKTRKGTDGYKTQGYMKRRVNFHPYADSRGYVNEHRLVMEQHLGRFLSPDEVVHHRNQIRDDNRLENLELYTDQNRHAEAHSHISKRDEDSKRWIPDPLLATKKFRLFNKNNGLMEVRNLSDLINKQFRNGQFEFRGTFTGLKDKNGKEIYEGDCLSQHDGVPSVGAVVEYRGAAFRPQPYSFDLGERMPNTKQFLTESQAMSYQIIGNIYENPELLKERP